MISVNCSGLSRCNVVHMIMLGTHVTKSRSTTFHLVMDCSDFPHAEYNPPYQFFPLAMGEPSRLFKFFQGLGLHARRNIPLLDTEVRRRYQLARAACVKLKEGYCALLLAPGLSCRCNRSCVKTPL